MKKNKDKPGVNGEPFEIKFRETEERSYDGSNNKYYEIEERILYGNGTWEPLIKNDPDLGKKIMNSIGFERIFKIKK